MEFTRPNDRGELSLHETDTLKAARYTPLRDLLASLPPGWEVRIPTFSLGIRGSYIPDRWTANLNRLGMSGARVDKLTEGKVSQALGGTASSDHGIHETGTVPSRDRHTEGATYTPERSASIVGR
jgi:hypothetical protein